MEFTELLKKRKSVRSYLEKEVEKEKVERIIQAGLYSPTGMNLQKRRYTVLSNKDLMRKFEKVLGNYFSKEDYTFYRADKLIIVSVDRDVINAIQDTSCAMMTMMLKAEEEGLGSCWINQFKEKCDKKELRELLSQIKIPENELVWAALAIGYIDKTPNVKERNEEIVYID